MMSPFTPADPSKGDNSGPVIRINGSSRNISPGYKSLLRTIANHESCSLIFWHLGNSGTMRTSPTVSMDQDRAVIRKVQSIGMG